MKAITFVTLLFAAVIVAGCKTGSGPAASENAVTLSAVNADSVRILYVGTYTEKEDFVEGKATGMYIYKLNLNSGRLSYVGSSPHTVNPSYLVVDASSQNLYAVNETASKDKPAGTISAFRLTAGGNTMEYVNTVSSQGNAPCYISLDKTRKWVMCANYGSGTVAVIPVLNDGKLGNATFTHQHRGKGSTPRQDSPHAHLIVQSPYNEFVYSCDLGLDTIFIYKLNAEKGILSRAGKSYATMPGAGPRHLAFHPSGKVAYEVNELNGTIEVMDVDSATGSLSRIQVISTRDASMKDDAACADIHLTPSGSFLYASNRGNLNNLAMFSVDRQTGKLTLIGHQGVHGKTPRNFVIDPTGKFLLVANQDSGNVVTFRIDPSSGKLIDTGLETSIPTPVCLKFLE
jgi:6-phosphogluconolactonase